MKTQDGGITWAIQQYGLEYDLTDVCFVDANTGWIVNGSWTYPDSTNFILHTSDGGINWVQQTYSLVYGAGLLSVYFVDAHIGYAAGYYNSVFKTTDGGENWQLKIANTGSKVITDIHFVDANKGWVTQHRQDLPKVNNDGSVGFSEEGQILNTVDGGNTWTVQMDTLNAYLFGITFLDSSFGFAVGETPANPYGSGSGMGIILGTEDGGTNWTIINTGISMGWESTFKDFCFTNGRNGILVGNSGVILKSSNIGEIWDFKLNGTMNDLRGLAFTNASNGFAVGAAGTILRTTNSGTMWTSQSSGTSLQLNDICFTDENNGWIVGTAADDWGDNDSSIILHTTDNGATWAIQASWVGSMHLYDLYFVDANIGWIVGTELYGVGDYHGAILKTIDGGVNWNKSTNGNSSLWSIFFVNENTGWAVGHDGTILKTTNGGTSWINQIAPYHEINRSVYFVDENVGWVLANDALFHSTNGGNTWNVQIPYSSTNAFSSIKFIDSNNGWILSNDFKNQGSQILRTSDGGTTWSPLSLGTHRWLNEFYFEDLNNGWIVGENGMILHTTNGGVVPVELNSFTAAANGKEVILNWSTATELNNQGFEVQRKIGGNDFLTIGSVKGHGTTTSPNNYTYVDKLTDAGKYFYRLKQIDFGGKYEYSQTVEVNWSPFISYKLEQNYPNPFNPTTTIGFGIREKGNVRLSVLNILGEEIKVLLNEEKEAGYHSIDFSGSDLPSGVYFYHLKAGPSSSSGQVFIYTKKMLLLK